MRILIFGLFALAGCSEIGSQQTATSFDQFTECVRDKVGDQQIDQAIRESCLLKHEELSESYSFDGATAAFVEKGVLEVSIRNPYEFLVTNLEIAFFSPLDDGANCRESQAKCSTRFASGRVWLLPNTAGTVRIVPPGEYNTVNLKGEYVWSFRVQSVRLLRLD